MKKPPKLGNYTIPFTTKGIGAAHMLEYVSCAEGEVSCKEFPWYQPTEWRANAAFDATLQITGHHRGRSSVRVRVTNLANRETYSLGFASFYDAMMAGGVTPEGTITGRWQFRKQGANYGLVRIG